MRLQSVLEAADIDSRFGSLVEQWRREIGPTASITERMLHPAYQQIIRMGPAAIPLLLRELEQRPDHWFWALKAITGADPVKPEERGKLEQMANAWLRWGDQHGYNW